MRFVFEKGGRTGCKSLEALADYMETFEETTPAGPGLFDQATMALRDLGALFVDHSPTQSAPGELFKTRDQMWSDWVRATSKEQTLRDVAAIYWAEAEAAELARITAAQAPKDSESRGWL